MGLTSKITSKISAKLVKPGTRTVRVENGVKITKFEKTGTEVMHLSPLIKVVRPGENTKLGKMGIESIASFKPGSFGLNKETLYSVQAKGAKQAAGLFNSKEAKSWLELIEAFQKEAKKASNPLVKMFNKVTGK